MIKNFQILGYSAGMPTQFRGASSVMVTTQNYNIMIDCGEGTFLRWQKAKYNWKSLRYILITHMHFDHIGGLLPLLFYRKIYNIKSPLTIIGPPNLKKYIIYSFNQMGSEFNQTIKIIDIEKELNIKLSNDIEVNALEMVHKIPCWGYGISDNKNKLVFITDTRPNKNIIKLAKKADILIHEATYLHQDRNKAFEHFHSTELQAMEMADKSQVKRLILTHFSQRIGDDILKTLTWQGQACVIFDKIQELD